MASNVGDLGLIPRLGWFPGEGKGYPLYYSGLNNSMDCESMGFKEPDTTERLSLLLFIADWQCYDIFRWAAKGLSHTSIWTHSPPNSGGFSFQSMGSRCVAVAYGVKLFCSIWDHLDQELNLCPLHWQADSCPLDYQGSPKLVKYIPSET